MTENLCMGCGGKLQNTDVSAPFYTPKSLSAGDNILCQRCYKLRHYGQITPSFITAESFTKILDTFSEKDVLIVKVIDLFDLEGSVMPQIHKLTHHKDLIILANKRDLLPKIVRDNKLKHILKKFLSDMQIKPLDIYLVSALKKQPIDTIIDALFYHAKGRDILMVGATNTGKSTLINAFIQASTASKENLITVSSTRGTTQGVIPIPFGEQTLYDTPGLYNKNHLATFVPELSQKKLHPKKEIKPRVFQMIPPQTLILSGIIRIDYTRGDKASFIVYMNNELPIHRRKTEGTEDYFKRHKEALLRPLKLETFDYELKPHTFAITKRKQDIVIPGLGFITIIGRADITVYTPQGLTPYMRGVLIG